MTTGLRIVRTRAQQSLEIWRMPLGPMPLPQDQRPALAAFLVQLLHAVGSRYQLTETVWIEATHIHLEGATRLLAPNARVWAPRTGFGIHPDGEAPRMWTKDDFSGAAYGVEPPIFNNQVFEVSRPAGHASAIELMAGRGLLTLALLAGSSTEFKQGMQAILGPMVQERAFHAYSFFFPLLSTASAESPQLTTWMGNATVYVREVFDEQHLLVISRVPLEPCLRTIGAQAVSDGVWVVEQKEERVWANP